MRKGTEFDNDFVREIQDQFPTLECRKFHIEYERDKKTFFLSLVSEVDFYKKVNIWSMPNDVKNLQEVSCFFRYPLDKKDQISEAVEIIEFIMSSALQEYPRVGIDWGNLIAKQEAYHEENKGKVITLDRSKLCSDSRILVCFSIVERPRND